MANPGPARGTLTITSSSSDAVVLCADIGGYGVTWPARKRVFQGIGGSVTVQDFGRYQADLRWSARSAGTAGYIASSDVVLLDRILGTRGALPTYTDSLGSSGTVTLLDFQPTRERADLFSWSLTVQAATLNYFLGSTYGGA